MKCPDTTISSAVRCRLPVLIEDARGGERSEPIDEHAEEFGEMPAHDDPSIAIGHGLHIAVSAGAPEYLAAGIPSDNPPASFASECPVIVHTVGGERLRRILDVIGPRLPSACDRVKAGLERLGLTIGVCPLADCDDVAIR